MGFEKKTSAKFTIPCEVTAVVATATRKTTAFKAEPNIIFAIVS